MAEKNTCELKTVESREVRAVSDRHKSVKQKADQFSSPGPKIKSLLLWRITQSRGLQTLNREMLSVQGWPYRLRSVIQEN